MKYYHTDENKDTYYDENDNLCIVYLREGYVSLEEFQEYCKELRKVSYAFIGIDKIENDTLYFYSDMR